MKKTNNILSLAVCLAALLLLTLSSPAHGQEVAAAASGQPDVPLDLQLQKTDLATACRLIADRYETKAKRKLNMVVSPDASKVILPDMDLHGVTLHQFASFLNGLTLPDAELKLEETEGIWLASARVVEPPPQAPIPSIFDLGDDPEGAMSLIEELLKTRAAEGMELKYHEPSRTLIATGQTRELLLIEQVVNLFAERQAKARALAKPPQAPIHSIFDLGDDPKGARALIDEVMKTSAIQSAELKYHEPSRSLIAVGQTHELLLIERALQLFTERRAKSADLEGAARSKSKPAAP